MMRLITIPLAALAFLLYTTPFLFAHAQEASAEAEVSVEESAQTQTDAQGRPIKPLDLIRRAKEAQQNINRNAMEARRELNADTKADLKAAPPGEKGNVLRGAVDARMEIGKERREDSQELRMKVREGIRTHGGLIRERFTNAITHLEKFMTRIDSRLDKFAAAGADVSAAVALQTSAQASIDAAKTDIAAVRTYIEGVTDESDRATVKAELEVLIKDARESIRAAHTSMRALVKAVVDIGKTVRPTTSTSVEVTASTTVETQ